MSRAKSTQLKLVEELETPKKKHTRTEYSNDFNIFWKTYPTNNGNKFAAFEAWKKALDAGYSPEEIIEGAKCHRVARAGENSEYTQHASTWLSLTWEKGRGWEVYDENHWAYNADILTAALISELKIAWSDLRNEHSQALVFRAVFSKFSKNTWADHAYIPQEAKERLLDADYRLRELGANVKPFSLPPSMRPDWGWVYPEADNQISEFLANRLKMKAIV